MIGVAKIEEEARTTLKYLSNYSAFLADLIEAHDQLDIGSAKSLFETMTYNTNIINTVVGGTTTAQQISVGGVNDLDEFIRKELINILSDEERKPFFKVLRRHLVSKSKQIKENNEINIIQEDSISKKLHKSRLFIELPLKLLENFVSSLKDLNQALKQLENERSANILNSQIGFGTFESLLMSKISNINTQLLYPLQSAKFFSKNVIKNNLDEYNQKFFIKVIEKSYFGTNILNSEELFRFLNENFTSIDQVFSVENLPKTIIDDHFKNTLRFLPQDTFELETGN